MEVKQMSDRVISRTAKQTGFRARLARIFKRPSPPAAPPESRQLSAPLLKSKAVAVRSNKCQYDFTIQNIRFLMEEIGKVWKNDIHASFVEEFESMQGALGDFSHMLEGYVALLDIAAQELETYGNGAEGPVFAGRADSPVDFELADQPYLKRSLRDIEAYDPYCEQTQAGVSARLVASKKTLEYIYNVYEDHVELVTYLGVKRSIVIPSELEGLPVTHIGHNCFAYAWRVKLETVVIPEPVATIYHGAFRGCQSIREISLPPSLRYIGNYAFAFLTNLESIRIPDGVVSIGTGAFRNCDGLLNVEIPDSTLRIGNDCFYRCKRLETVDIGNGVIDIDGWAFRMSERLNRVTMGNEVVNIGASAFYDCICLDKLDVPEKVMKIGEGAFHHRRGMTIGCVRGTVAESYAIENKLNYVYLKKSV
jgi:uncharacterized protein YukE